MNQIITVAREFGSGGRQFARKLAEELGYEYYDKEILAEIAKHTDLSEEYIKSVVDRKPHSLFPISVGHSFSSGMDYQLQQMQSIFSAQFDIINKLAEKSNCVIVGRCADYILREKKPLRLFIYADMDYKVQRCLKNRKDDEPDTAAEFEKLIKKLDKNRAKYYNDYTGQEWGDKQYFDLCINTTNVDMDTLVKNFAKAFK